MKATNAERLATVVSEWSRPAIFKIASDRIDCIPFIGNIRSAILCTGIVGQNYKVSSDIIPFLNPILDTLLHPMLAKAMSNIPDESIPDLAINIINTAIENGAMSILDDAITFEKEDLEELKEKLLKEFKTK